MAMCIKNLQKEHRVGHISPTHLAMESFFRSRTLMGLEFFRILFRQQTVGVRMVNETGAVAMGLGTGKDLDVTVTFPSCGDPQKQCWCKEAYVRGMACCPLPASLGSPQPQQGTQYLCAAKSCLITGRKYHGITQGLLSHYPFLDFPYLLIEGDSRRSCSKD